MKGAGRREKGAGGEREVVGILRDCGFDAWRTQNVDGNQRERGDIFIRDEAVVLDVKRQERLQMQQWSYTLEASTPTTHIPVIVYRTSRNPWRASMPLLDFCDLLRMRGK